jgi:hypothetical protein
MKRTEKIFGIVGPILAIILFLFYVSFIGNQAKQHDIIIKPDCINLCMKFNCTYVRTNVDSMNVLHSQNAEQGDQCKLVFCTENNCWSMALIPENKER